MVKLYFRSINPHPFQSLKNSLCFSNMQSHCHITIAVPVGGAGGTIAPEVSKIWAKFKFFGQRYEKFGQSQKF